MNFCVSLKSKFLSFMSHTIKSSKFNKCLKIIIKKQNKKKIIKIVILSKFENFENFNINKKLDFKNSRFKLKRFSYINFSIFFEYKNFNTFAYIKYDI